MNANELTIGFSVENYLANLTELIESKPTLNSQWATLRTECLRELNKSASRGEDALERTWEALRTDLSRW